MATEIQINAAAKALRQGDLVGFPTETVYGLGADALNPIAVAKIFELKKRPRFDPLIVHVAHPSDIEQLVDSIPSRAQALIERFWPGPLSLVFKKKSDVPDIVTAGLASVAVRCPENEVARKLIQAAGVPVAAPSANRFGMVSPTTAQHVADQFGNQLLHILDDGPCRVGVESTVVSFADPQGEPQLLRPGGVTLEQLESVVGPIQVNMHEEAQPSSPGQLTQHYSPETQLRLQEGNKLATARQGKTKVGLLAFQAPDSDFNYTAVEVLSKDGCLRESAANLFAAMRRLDAAGLELIIAQSVPEVDLGRAIMDRLRRAAAK